MTTVSNGYTGGHLKTGPRIAPVEDMAAYDRLPAGVRALLAEMPIDVVAVVIERMVNRLGEEGAERRLRAAIEEATAECRRLNEEACSR